MVFYSVLCKVYTSIIRYQRGYGTVEVLQKLFKSLVENVKKNNNKSETMYLEPMHMLSRSSRESPCPNHNNDRVQVLSIMKASMPKP